MKKLLYSLFLLSFITGCSPSSEKTDIAWKEKNLPAAIQLNAYDSIHIQQTFSLLTWSINDKTVYFVSNETTDSFLTAYSYPKCRKKFKYGKTGQGPDEFITLNCGEAADNNILLYDIMGRKALILSTDNDTLEITDRMKLYDNADGLCKPFTFITQINGEKCLMKVDDADDSSWEITDLRNGTTLSEFKNPVRKKNISYTPFDFIQSINDTILMAAYKYIDRIEYYSIKGYRIRPLFAMGSKTDQSSLQDYNYLMQYYIAVVPYRNSFFCLKSDDGFESGNIIEVYDKNGDCKTRYVLDKKIHSIRFDKEGYMVGYAENTDQTLLYRFRTNTF